MTLQRLRRQQSQEMELGETQQRPLLSELAGSARETKSPQTAPVQQPAAECRAASAIWLSWRLITTTISCGLVLAALLLFLPVGGDWTSVPDDNSVKHWYGIAAWASVYYVTGWSIVEAQVHN